MRSTSEVVNAFWLIPAPPLFGALAMLLVGRKLANRVVSVLCCGTVLLSFAIAVAAFAGLLADPDRAIVSATLGVLASFHRRGMGLSMGHALRHVWR